MTDGKKRNRYILEHASTEEDVTVLNTTLIDFIVNDKGTDPRIVERLAAQILLLCRSYDSSIELVSVALATALFMIYNQSSPVCMVEKMKPFIKKLQ